MLFIVKIIAAFIGGVLPVLIWLWFFEHEDKHPEPHKLTLIAFIAGMAGIFLAIPLEGIIKEMYGSLTISVLFLWAAIEEILKYALAYWAVLHRTENDEPIDSIMYLIATALGFAALENVLFIVTPLLDGQPLQAALTNSFRFVGATLLHIVASGIIGIALALSFYMTAATKRIYTVIGLILAIVLHTLFNLTILISNGNTAIVAFFGVWIVCIGILLAIEKVKSITKPLV